MIFPKFLVFNNHDLPTEYDNSKSLMYGVRKREIGLSRCHRDYCLKWDFSIDQTENAGSTYPSTMHHHCRSQKWFAFHHNLSTVTTVLLCYLFTCLAIHQPHRARNPCPTNASTFSSVFFRSGVYLREKRRLMLAPPVLPAGHRRIARLGLL